MNTGLLLPGVDKLAVHTRDFHVSDYRSLHKNQTTAPNKEIEDLPVLMVDSRGQGLHATKAWADTKGRRIPYQVDFDKNGMLLAVNPSKALHPWKLNSDVNSIEEFLSSVHKDCKEIGIHFDLDGARIKRLDLAKQDFMDRALSMYGPAYDFMNGSRKKKNVYPSGATWHNKQDEVCFYDKGLESKIPIIEGLLRAESRFLKDNKVSAFVGVNTVSEFLRTDCYTWDEAYKKHLNRSVFDKAKSDLFIMDFDSEVDRLRQIAKIKKKNICVTYVSAHGIIAFLSMPGGLDQLKAILNASGVVGTKAVDKFMREVDSIISLMPKPEGMVSVLDLVHELKMKFAA